MWRKTTDDNQNHKKEVLGEIFNQEIDEVNFDVK
jgi:hypothetical protein